MVISPGIAVERDGSKVPLRHTLTRITGDRIAAIWEADLGEGLAVAVDEICERSN